MFLFFHSTNSQISVNVSTTTVTTTTEAVRLPLSLTLSSTSEGTICTPSTPSTLARETDDESMEKAGTPDPNQEDDARLAKPYFPTHPFRNARLNSIVNTPSPTRPFFLHSDPCPFPSPPSLPQSRRSSFSNQHVNSNIHAVKLSTRSKFAKLLHFIPSGSKNRSRKELEKSGAAGYHYWRARDRLRQEKADKGAKTPGTLWGSESYM